jgi:alpha,alpha-trehalase
MKVISFAKIRAGASACLLIIVLLTPSASASAQRSRRATTGQLRSIQSYIRQSWETLTRSNKDLVRAALDPKFPLGPGQRSIVYISTREDVHRVESSLRKQMPAADFAKIELRQLPRNLDALREPGLLYLPHPYVVPGGRFNEMYGWDSYFIQVGLLRAGAVERARDMADNFIYEIENYGKILNANRSYYLTRSQPPFLTEMILSVYGRTHDTAWLQRAVPAIETYYNYWTTGPHFVPETGLSRYYDFGVGPAPEVVADELDERGRTHYDRVREYYRNHEITDYDVNEYYDRGNDRLTELFYKGDRSMRESGFDPSNRFGQFNVDIVNYNPVCLNSLLYLMEKQAAEIELVLGHRSAADTWLKRAHDRAERMNRLMWDEQDRLYYDYNFKRKELRRYPFVTTFYPLWSGIASRVQASRIVKNLSLFERPGGLQTSTKRSGSQWDAPFGWAPMQMIAVTGLRRYGYNSAANRIAVNFLSLVLKEFVEHNVIVEKYDVERRVSQIQSGLRFGYKSNEIGFGWTNAAFIELYANLPRQRRLDILNLDGPVVGVLRLSAPRKMTEPFRNDLFFSDCPNSCMGPKGTCQY